MGQTREERRSLRTPLTGDLKKKKKETDQETLKDACGSMCVSKEIRTTRNVHQVRGEAVVGAKPVVDAARS